MELNWVLNDVLDAIVEIDESCQPFKEFHPGVGPYGEPQLIRAIAERLNKLPRYQGRAVTKRTPDLLLPDHWAIEFKIVRPFGDNGKEAEDWSVNLLHPYPGNISLIGDCLKLVRMPGHERRAVVAIGYEHSPAVINLTPLVDAFEAIARSVWRITLSERLEVSHVGLIHPVHQVVRLFAWEVLS